MLFVFVVLTYFFQCILWSKVILLTLDVIQYIFSYICVGKIVFRMPYIHIINL